MGMAKIRFHVFSFGGFFRCDYMFSGIYVAGDIGIAARRNIDIGTT